MAGKPAEPGGPGPVGGAPPDKPMVGNPPGSPPGEGWTSIGCVDGNRVLPKLFAGVELTRPLDYVGIYQQFSANSAFMATSEARVGKVTERGMPCPGADDADAGGDSCLEQLATARAATDRCKTENACTPLLITARDNQVMRSDDRKDLIALLGTIDSPAEAMLLALFDGYDLACPSGKLSGTWTRADSQGFELSTEWEYCGPQYRQVLSVAADGTVIDRGKTEIGNSGCQVGRRPAGLLAAEALSAGTRVAELLAQAARLEAASVFAFERLARELAALRAPAELIGEAARSALDEIRHARAMTALARRYGAEPARAHVAPLPLRAPFAIALENAIEGCVRESYGALVAHHQAQTALDPDVRAIMRGIADDETRHATLSWCIAAWLEPQLTAAEREALGRARSEAVAQLQREVDVGLSAREERSIGWPAPALAVQMIARFSSAVGLA